MNSWRIRWLIGVGLSVLLASHLAADELLSRGAELLKKGHWEAAAELFTQSLANAGGAGAQLHRAQAYLVGKRWDDALRDVQAVLELQPKNREAWQLCAEVHWQRGDVPAAAAAFTQAIELQDDWDTRIRRGGCYLRMGDAARTIADFSAAIRINPEDRRGWAVRAAANMQFRRFREQIADLNHLIQHFPDDAGLYDSRAVAYLQLEEFEPATKDLSQLIELQPLDVGHRLRRGNCRQRLGEFQLAIDDYAHVIELDPRNATAWGNRGAAWSALQKDDAALADLTRAVELDPQLTAAYQHRAAIFLRRQEFAKAERDLRRAVELAPDDQELRGRWAEAQARVGKHDAPHDDRPPIPAPAPEPPGGNRGGLTAYASDTFARDTRGDYRIEGTIQWTPGTLDLHEGATLTRAARSGSPFEVELALEFPLPGSVDPLKPLVAETQLTLIHVNNDILALRWSLSKTGAGTLCRAVVMRLTLDARGEVQEHVLREASVAGVPDGTWRLRYQYGLLVVERAGTHVVSGYSENLANIGTIVLSQRVGRCRCRALRLSGAPPLKAFSPEQIRQLEAVGKIMQQATADALAGRARESLAAAQTANRRCLEAVGQDHPLAVSTLGLVANALAGNFDPAAIALFDEFVAANRRVFGDDHPRTADALAAAASQRLLRGDRAGAGTLWNRAFEIQLRTQGENSRAVAELLTKRAELLAQSGKPAAAREQYEWALRVYTQLGLDRDPVVADILVELGCLAMNSQDFGAARQKLEAARDILEAVEQPNDAARANVYRYLGALAHKESRFDEARQGYRHALELQEKVRGATSFSAISTLADLARLAREEENVPEARRLLEQAVARAEEGHRMPPLGMVTLYGDLCATCLQDLRDAEAVSWIEKAVRLQVATTNQVLPALSEAETLAFLAEQPPYATGCLDMLTSPPWADPTKAYSLVWALRALATQAIASRQRRFPPDSAAARLWDELKQVRGQLVSLVMSDATPEQAIAWQERLAAVNERKELLERQLAGESQAFGREQRIGQADFADLAAQLPPAVAMLEFVKIRTAYHAFVLRQATGEPPWSVRHVDLGPAQKIDDAVRQTRILTHGTRGSRRLTGDVVEDAGHEAPDALRGLVWEPVEAHLAGCETVIVIPESSLTRVPWPALPGRRKGSYLIEDYALSTATYGRQVYDLLTRPEPAGDRVLLLGGVWFGESAGATPGGPPATAGLRSERSWQSLPGTEQEAESLAALWRSGRPAHACSTLAGKEATEAALVQSLPGHRFVHLATHGFFAGEQSRAQQKSDSEATGRASPDSPSRGLLAATLARNPLVLSGLVLAGANRAVAADMTRLPPASDGILTAEEVASLDLQDTELVVLSACETGLGEVAGGEGVFGLQRAFGLAGVRTVVASLWKVDDSATRVLMEEFYRNLWQQKLGKLAALRTAQLTVLRRYDPARGTLRDPPAASDSHLATASDPFYWAAFVLSGDWR